MCGLGLLGADAATVWSGFSEHSVRHFPEIITLRDSHRTSVRRCLHAWCTITIGYVQKNAHCLNDGACDARSFKEQELCSCLTQGLIESDEAKVSGSGKSKQIGIGPFLWGRLSWPV